MTRAAREVLAERQRQVTAEGWTEGHDDMHTDGSMAMVAALYAAPRDDLKIASTDDSGVRLADPWPVRWNAARWDKRKTHARRKRLVIAGALILAELERMDRRERVLSHRPGPLERAWKRCRGWLADLRHIRFVGHPPPTPPANLFKKK